jgi:hypothetical protein
MYTLDTIFLFVFIFSVLNIIRTFFGFISALVKNPPEHFILYGRELIFFGLSLSYIITYLIKI